MNMNSDPYRSRIAGRWEAVERREPARWGQLSGPLPDADAAQYEHQGFLLQQDLFTPDEIKTYTAIANTLAKQPSDHGISADELIIEPDNQEVRSIFRIHQTQPIFQQLAQDPRLLGVARQLLGGDVYIHQSRINFKPGFDGREFYWHSDFETWHMEDGMPQMRAVSVSIMLTDNNEFNGPLMLIPGSHKLFIRCEGKTPENHHLLSLKKQEYGVPNHEALSMLIERGGIQSAKGNAGTTLFFECNTMHGSAGNLTPFPRSNIFLVYNSVDNALQAPFCGQPPRPNYLAERQPTAL